MTHKIGHCDRPECANGCPRTIAECLSPSPLDETCVPLNAAGMLITRRTALTTEWANYLERHSK